VRAGAIYWGSCRDTRGLSALGKNPEPTRPRSPAARIVSRAVLRDDDCDLSPRHDQSVVPERLLPYRVYPADGLQDRGSRVRLEGQVRGIMNDRIWTAALVVIGDEILSGRTHDKNIAQVASWLQVQGIRLSEVRVVPDLTERIVEAVNALRTTHDYLFTTGGIGPTHDDISVDAVAAALRVPVVIHPEARRILEDYYAARGGLTDARLRMARVPEGSDLIPNRMSGAPGIRIGNVHMMAGVPHICAQMLDALTGTLEGGAPLLTGTLGFWGAES